MREHLSCHHHALTFYKDKENAGKYKYTSINGNGRMAVLSNADLTKIYATRPR